MVEQNNTGNLPFGGEEPIDSRQSLPKARTDVEITEQVYFGKPCYVLKDPAALRYYRLRPPEHVIHQMLDGKNTIEDVLKVLAERFPNEQYDSQAVMNFIIMLRGANLLQVSGAAGTEYLFKRKQMQKQGLFKKLRREFLFYRIPLLDPDRMLNWMEARWSKYIFSRLAGFLAAALLIGALALVISEVDKLGQRKPLLDWINLLYVGPMLLLIKAIHEIGHGLTSKHFDCEVHEMGILFLVFMPMAYCDVSDAWMISEKRRRMWITAAGIVVEVMMAAMATYIWAITPPRTVLNQFALNMMLIGTINTLLFNGNPLLRYDGYYFLMDLMELPNLKQKGSSYLWYLMQRYVLGVEKANKPIDVEGREGPVLGYGLLRAIYGWFIRSAFVTWVWIFLDPYGWGVVVGVMAIGCIYNAFITPVFKFVKFIYTQHHRMKVRLATAVILVLLLGGGAYGILGIDVEQSIEAQCVVRPSDFHPLYVGRAGFITEPNDGFVRDGQWVEANDVLMELSDPELEYKAKDLQLQLKQLRSQRAQARQQGAAGASQAALIDESIKEFEARYDNAQRNLEKLIILAPTSGILQIRTGVPLKNLVGSFLPVGTALFGVYKLEQFEAVTAVKGSDKGRITVGDAVQIKLWALEHLVFETEVKEIDIPAGPASIMSSAAFSVVYHGEVPTLPAASQEEALTPADIIFEYELSFSSQNRHLRDGMVGRTKIIVEKKSLGHAFYLWLLRTLRLDIRL